MDERPIAVFDSGIGGLPYLATLRRLLPNEAYIYVADREGFPYGRKSRDEVKSLTLARMDRIAARFDPKIIVIACNTASQAALASVRSAYPGIPFVGTVPAVKPAALSTETGVIAVLSTARASVDPYLDGLIARYAKGVAVVRIGAQELVEFVEERFLDASETERASACAAALEPALASRADRIVLACTHFLHVAEYIEAASGAAVHVVDSREGVARRAADLLARAGKEGPSGSSGGRGGLFATGGPSFGDTLPRFAQRFGLEFRGEL